MLMIERTTNHDLIKIAAACNIVIPEFVAELKAKGICNESTEDDIEKMDIILDADEREIK